MTGKWTLTRIENVFEQINRRLFLNVKPEIEFAEKSKFPLSRRKGKLMLVQDFFNHRYLNNAQRYMLIALFYSCVYLDKNKDGYLKIPPEFFAKGICEVMGYTYIPEYLIENTMREIRNEIYDEPEYYCCFSVGEQIKPKEHTRLEIVKITKENGQAYIEVKPVGYKPECYKGKLIFKEKELYELYEGKKHIYGEDINMRRNMFIISQVSYSENKALFNAIKEEIPTVQKAIFVTTRQKRDDEINGVDGYFCTKDEFYQYIEDDKLIEYTTYEGHYYGFFKRELERYFDDTLLIVFTNIFGERQINMRYPMATSVFLKSPPAEKTEIGIELEKVDCRSQHNEGLNMCGKEIEAEKYFDYVVSGDNTNQTAKRIVDIINSQPQHKCIVKRHNGIFM